MVRAVHTVLLAHGEAVRAIRGAAKRPAKIGIALNLAPVYPAHDNKLDQHAAEKFDRSSNRLFLDPILRGSYPQRAWDAFGPFRPQIREGDMRRIAEPIDFLGRQLLHPKCRRRQPLDSFSRRAHGEGGGRRVFRDGLGNVSGRFGGVAGAHLERLSPAACCSSPKTGSRSSDIPDAAGAVEDPVRIAYLRRHLEVLHRTIQKGVPVQGYFVWSQMDNFEWSLGYSKRFGLVYVDFATQRRIRKSSFRWYREVIQQNGLEVGPLTIFLLVRHGETDWLGERLAGRLPDIHLNAKGRANAELLCAMLAPLELAAIYSSPLERAMETAEPAARAVGKPILRNDLLQEVDFGELAGKPFTELRETELWRLVHRSPEEVKYPSGESLLEAQARAVRAIEEIRSEQETGMVALFTHSDTIRLAVAHYLRMPLAAYHALVTDPASVSVIYFEPARRPHRRPQSSGRVAVDCETGVIRDRGTPCPNSHFEIRPVDRITVGAIGEPGKRVFYLQAAGAGTQLTLSLEKEQVQMLALSIEQFLDDLQQRFPALAEPDDRYEEREMRLEPPLEPEFPYRHDGIGIRRPRRPAAARPARGGRGETSRRRTLPRSRCGARATNCGGSRNGAWNSRTAGGRFAGTAAARSIRRATSVRVKMDTNNSPPQRLADTDAALGILREGTAELRGLFRLGSNDTFLCEMRSPRGALQAVYKPTKGERPLWDFPDGTLGMREAAAFETARYLGWDFVPPTVFRAEGPLGPGSFQEYLDLDFQRNYFVLREQEPDALRRVATFDILINNADRKALHVVTDAAGRIRLIDHGVCFHREWKLRTVIWDYAGEELPQEIIRVLDRLLASMVISRPEVCQPGIPCPARKKPGEAAEEPIPVVGLGATLAPFLSVEEIAAVETRARDLRNERCFPPPGPGISVPWPIWA